MPTADFATAVRATALLTCAAWCGLAFGLDLSSLSNSEATAGLRKALAASRRGVDPDRVVPVGIDGLRAALEAFVAVGFSKFVVRPIEAPGSWRSELEALAAGVLDLQT